MRTKQGLFVSILLIIGAVTGQSTKRKIAFDCSPQDKPGTCVLKSITIQEKDVVDDSSRPTAAKNVIFENSVVEYLPEVLFKRFPALESLHARGVGLKKFTPNVFSKSTGLKFLDVSANSIRVLPHDVFGTCQNLEEVHMAENRLHLLSGVELIGCNKLRQLNVSSNQLIFVNWEPMNDLRFLEQIDVSNNLLSSVMVPRYAKKIVIRYNHIHKLTTDPNSFIFMLEYLDASRNRLSNIDALARFGKLTFIDLSYNRLLNVDFALFKNMRFLRELRLDHNNIFAISSSSDTRPIAMEVVNLSYNELTRVSVEDSRGFSTVKNLILNNNYLVKLEIAKGLSNFPNLQSISLSSNDWACPDMEEMLIELVTRKISVISVDENCPGHLVKKKELCCRDIGTSFDELVLMESQKLYEIQHRSSGRMEVTSTIRPVLTGVETTSGKPTKQVSEDIGYLSKTLRETTSRLAIAERDLNTSNMEKSSLKTSLDKALNEMEALKDKLARCKSTVNQRTGQTVLID